MVNINISTGIAAHLMLSTLLYAQCLGIGLVGPGWVFAETFELVGSVVLVGSVGVGMGYSLHSTLSTLFTNTVMPRPP